jgi:hypothetical protein
MHVARLLIRHVLQRLGPMPVVTSRAGKAHAGIVSDNISYVNKYAEDLLEKGRGKLLLYVRVVPGFIFL